MSRLILCFVLGAISVLGFAPFYFFPLPLICLALLFRLWENAPGPRQAAMDGFAFGLGEFGAGVSWVYVSLHDFGSMPAPLAGTATLLFCALLALFPAAVGLAQAQARQKPYARWLLLVPALWVLLEWVRGWIFTGFPWLVTGYSQIPASPLSGFAPAIGVYGVSLAAVTSAGLIFLLLLRAAPDAGVKRLLCGAALVALWACGFVLKQIEWTKPTGAPVSVSLIQGNIAQSLKWEPERVNDTLGAYLQLALASPGKLIVLPETALPLFANEVPASYLETLTQHAKNNGGDVLIGIPEYVRHGEYYNSVFSFGAAKTQTYRKSHLVPFGEFIPPGFGWIVAVLKIPLSDFSRGAKTQPPLEVAAQRIGADICYEDAFGAEINRQLPAATLLVNASNVAWFGDSIAPGQHLQISQTRALEAGRFMLRATNTGMTAIVDQKGEVVAKAPEFTSTIVNGQAQGYEGATPYVLWGDSAALIAVAAGICLAALLGVFRSTENK